MPLLQNRSDVHITAVKHDMWRDFDRIKMSF